MVNVEWPLRALPALGFVMLALALGCSTRYPAPMPELDDPGYVLEMGVPKCSPDHPGFRACLARAQPEGIGQVSRLDCDGCAAAVRMSIMPVGNVRHIVGRAKLEAEPAAAGYIVAIIQNLDSLTFADLNLEPDETAYWWYGKDSGGAAVQSRFYAVRGEQVILLATGTERCPGDTIIRTEDEARWNKHDCPGPSHPNLNVSNSSWISCIDGCCTSGTIQAQPT